MSLSFRNHFNGKESSKLKMRCFIRRYGENSKDSGAKLDGKEEGIAGRTHPRQGRLKKKPGIPAALAARNFGTSSMGEGLRG